ncbi:MAG: carbohydrate kinase family protein [Candidatus Pacebacteria bacterium]|nr:carbohydrate kinase family protein [Candidatus Paceibacterota bacterium]
MEKNKNIDFMAIGDIVIDAFIKLKEAEIEYEHGVKMLEMRFGEKLPYDSVKVVKAVGNAPNASVSAARLGLNSAVMTHVGNDDFGKECLDSLEEKGVITDYVTVEDGKTTNYHYVLSFKAERTILIKHEEYNYDLATQAEGVIPKWVYFSSVGEKSMPYHADIAAWVKDNNIKMAFQPGTFQISLGAEKLKDIYEASEVFFCNVEEAQQILSEKSRDVKKMLKAMHDLGPKIVCITDGPDGAYAYDSYNDQYWFHPIYPDPKPPVERTGAGDSFSSAFTVALGHGKTVKEALSWAPINSMNVVQYIGAQEGLLTTEQLEGFLADAPDHYKPEQI